MLTVEDFLSRYENYSDEELYQIYLSIDDYANEAKEAVILAIKKRGGLEKITDTVRQKQLIRNEADRLRWETKKLFVSGTNPDFLKTLLTSDILSPIETHEIIEKKYTELELLEEDKKIKPRTIFGGVIGGGVASIIGGILWGLQMIQMHRIFYIFIIGLIILSYGIIRFFTKQSKANTAVLIATIISVIGSLIIGQLLFEIFG